jgi:rubrerythrin
VELTEKSQENLKEAQGLEYYNTRFYRAAAKSDSPEISGYFKYLAKIESEHYSVFTKLLGAEKDPSILEPSEALGSDIENLHHGREREAMASALYKKFTAEATEPRVREVFASVSQIEADHLHLDEEELKKLGSN